MEVPETHISGERIYKDITILDGLLKCCIISDKQVDKAAAAVTVGAGQMHDPTNFPGIAHLTEHMLFMGSKSYPLENEYDSYIQQHGGHTNAYTDLERTCYYFDIINNKLLDALDRFACSLIEPLINVNSVERELNAVESEHNKNITQDYWRTHQLSRLLLGVNQHPYSSFGTGNKQSLLQNNTKTHEDLRNAIYEFYIKHYYPANITLVVLGNYTIDELQKMVEETFVKRFVENKNNDTESENNSNYNKKEPSECPPTLPIPDKTIIVKWVPLQKECNMLDIKFILPPSDYISKPGKYYSHLIGYEGDSTTLLEVLRKHQLVQELYADSVNNQCHNFSIFHINMELTTLGLTKINTVIELVYYYIHNILDNIPEWVYDELYVTGNNQFQFLSKLDGAHTCSSLSTNMQLYNNSNHYLSGPYKVYEYNPTKINEIKEYMNTPALILLGSNTYENDDDTITDYQIDQWYGTKYKILDTTTDNNDLWIQAKERVLSTNYDNIELVKQLGLPKQNDMLPTDFTLVIDENPDLFQKHFTDIRDSSPKCLIDNDVCRLWYKADGVYKSPKINIMILIRYNISTPEMAVLSALYTEIVTELCNEFSYTASMAGLHCGFHDTIRGIEIQISGYNHKASILLERICQTIHTGLYDKLSNNDNDSNNLFFERMRKKLEQQYQSILSSEPYQHGSMVLDLVLLANNKGSVQKRLEYITNTTLLTKETLIQFSKQILSQFQLEMLVHGNVMTEYAKSLSDIIINTFKPVVPLRPTVALRGVQIQSSSNNKEYILRQKGWNVHDENSCIVNLYQIGIVDIRTNAILSLLLQLIREPAFNILRTEEQLGYIIFTSIKTSADHIKNLFILVQSDTHDPVHVNERIENFLYIFRSKILIDMSNEDYNANVNSLCESLLEKNKNLSEESSKHWNVITNQSYNFHRLHDIAKEAKQLTKIDIMRFFDKYILHKSPNRNKLSVQLFGTAHETLYQELTTTSGSAKNKNNENNNNDDATVVVFDNPDEFVASQPLYPQQCNVAVDEMMMMVDTTSVEK